MKNNNMKNNNMKNNNVRILSRNIILILFSLISTALYSVNAANAEQEGNFEPGGRPRNRGYYHFDKLGLEARMKELEIEEQKLKTKLKIEEQKTEQEKLKTEAKKEEQKTKLKIEEQKTEQEKLKTEVKIEEQRQKSINLDKLLNGGKNVKKVSMDGTVVEYLEPRSKQFSSENVALKPYVSPKFKATIMKFKTAIIETTVCSVKVTSVFNIEKYENSAKIRITCSLSNERLIPWGTARTKTNLTFLLLGGSQKLVEIYENKRCIETTSTENNSSTFPVNEELSIEEYKKVKEAVVTQETSFENWLGLTRKHEKKSSKNFSELW